jgi:hypothetical protein
MALVLPYKPRNTHLGDQVRSNAFLATKVSFINEILKGRSSDDRPGESYNCREKE